MAGDQPKASMSGSAIVGAGPESDAGVTCEPISTAVIAVAAASRPTIRLIHPVRTGEPVAAASISRIDEKWLRFGDGRPAACTTAIDFASHNGISGASSG